MTDIDFDAERRRAERLMGPDAYDKLVWEEQYKQPLDHIQALITSVFSNRPGMTATAVSSPSYKQRVLRLEFNGQAAGDLLVQMHGESVAIVAQSIKGAKFRILDGHTHVRSSSGAKDDETWVQRTVGFLLSHIAAT